MLKIGQNWDKIANYPLNAQQRSAPLSLIAISKAFAASWASNKSAEEKKHF